MKRKLLSLVMAGAMVLSLAACTGGSNGNVAPAGNGGNGNNGGGDVNVVLQLDDYQFGNAVIRSVNSNTRRTGQLQIEGI